MDHPEMSEHADNKTGRTPLRRFHLPKFNITITVYQRHNRINNTRLERFNRILSKIKILNRFQNVDSEQKSAINFNLARRLEKSRRLLGPPENKTLVQILKENLAKEGDENTEWIDDLVAKVQAWFDSPKMVEEDLWKRAKNLASLAWKTTKDSFGRKNRFFDNS